MDYQEAKCYCLAKPAVFEDYPFGPEALVFKVKSKLFAILGTEDRVGRINLKCDPDQAVALRDIFPAVIPGYHMNKRHWNTVILDGSIPVSEIERMIDHSYTLVVKSLTKAERQPLEMEFGEEVLYL